MSKDRNDNVDDDNDKRVSRKQEKAKSKEYEENPISKEKKKKILRSCHFFFLVLFIVTNRLIQHQHLFVSIFPPYCFPFSFEQEEFPSSLSSLSSRAEFFIECSILIEKAHETLQ